MKFVFIAAEKALYPVVVLCRVLEVSSSGFYAWLKRAVALHAKVDAQLIVELRLAHQRSRETYGSPRLHAELRAPGVRVRRKRVERLMRENGIRAREKRRFRRTTNSNHSLAVVPSVLRRRFRPAAPNVAWVTDVTYIATDVGWSYLAVLLDLFSRRVVGWSMSPTNDRGLALAALDEALRTRRPERGLVHHSDRGSPYASDEYRRALRDRGIVASMSRRGDCYRRPARDGRTCLWSLRRGRPPRNPPLHAGIEDSRAEDRQEPLSRVTSSSSGDDGRRLDDVQFIVFSPATCPPASNVNGELFADGGLSAAA